MKTPLIIVCLLGCFLAPGCRTHQRIAMLEQECRMHEDRVYQIEDELQMTQSMLRSVEQEKASLQAKLAGGDVSGGGVVRPPQLFPQTKDPHADAPTGVDVQLPGSGAKEVSPDVLENMQGTPPKPAWRDPNALPPLETPTAPPFKAPPSSDDPARPGRPAEREVEIQEGKVLYRQEGPRLRGDSREVSEITVSEMMTGGIDADGLPGDEGVFLVVEPRNDRGELVPAAGPISIIAFDPSLPKEQSQLARWDFSETELANQFRRSGSAEGFHLEVRWPDMTPNHEHLKLFVRYTTDDSRKLYAQVPIRVALTPRTNPLVRRPMPSRPETASSDGSDDFDGWTARFRDKLSPPESVASSTSSSSDIASAPSRPILPPTSSIPPSSEEPSYLRTTSRPRPSWSPIR